VALLILNDLYNSYIRCGQYIVMGPVHLFCLFRDLIGIPFEIHYVMITIEDLIFIYILLVCAGMSWFLLRTAVRQRWSRIRCREIFVDECSVDRDSGNHELIFV
jgi:hypothetical protein